MKNIEKVGALALNAIFGYEPQISRTLIDNLGSAGAVFSMSGQELRDIFGPYSKHVGKITPDALDRAEKELSWLESQGCGFLAMTEPGYPKPLLECPDPPVGIYVRSATPAAELFADKPYVSVVGTRDISQYGSEWCRRIVGAMAQAPQKPTIVSGLAIGVDITAHLAALECGLPTIAVIPTGITDVYPRRHEPAAARIVSTPGSALITDYPPGTTPQPVNFLRRNRIIAGLSQATVLVESKSKGGGTMTARLAADYGRDVFALPGRIDDIRSAGCNLLIQEKIAESISSLGGLPEAIGLGRWHRMRTTDLLEEVRERFEGRADGMLEDLLRVAAAVRKHRGISFEELSEMLEIPYPSVSVLAGLLESERFISIDMLQRCAIVAKIS